MDGQHLSGWIRAGTLATLLLTGCDKGETQTDPINDPASNLATGEQTPQLPHERQDQTLEVAGFQVILDADGSNVKILRDGNTYWSYAGSEIAIVDKALGANADITPGTDITGDGMANLIISETLAESTRFTLLRLGQEIDALAQLESGPGNDAGFRDFDGDAVLEFVTRDATWDDLLKGDSPRVVLRWNGSAYIASAKDLARPAPRLDQLEPKIEQIILADDWQSGTPPTDLWREALDLAFSGHEDLAVQFLKFAWPEGQPGRDDFIETFLATLQKSEFYPQMASQFASAPGG